MKSADVHKRKITKVVCLNLGGRERAPHGEVDARVAAPVTSPSRVAAPMTEAAASTSSQNV